ncbi:hypothetical protein PA7559_09380 [Pseudoalteromonas distincta]
MKQSTAFTPSLIAGATIALSAGFTTITYAAEEARKVERIEVTGSRIKRSDIEGPSPVQSIGRADIENMGYDNLQQLLERMPVAVLSQHVVTTKIQLQMGLLLLVYVV